MIFLKANKYFILSIVFPLFLTLSALASAVNATVFEVTKATLDFTGDEDIYSVSGKIDFGLIDLTKNDLVFEVGSYNETIDAGSFVKTGSEYVYKAKPYESGIKEMILDLNAKTFFVEAFDADIYGSENPVEISVLVGEFISECASINMEINETDEGEIWSFNGRSKKCDDDDSDSEDVTSAESATASQVAVSTSLTTTTVFQTTTATSTSTTTSTINDVSREKVKNRICIFF